MLTVMLFGFATGLVIGTAIAAVAVGTYGVLEMLFGDDE